MKIHRFEVPGLAHYSYIVQSNGAAAVVDPKRDIDTYLAFARENGTNITHVLETHIHADFVSGARGLAEATGSELWLSAHDSEEQFQYRFDHSRLRDGQELKVGPVRISALHTPGHTPEHLSFLVQDDSRGSYPAALLSGDFMFVGSFGRPDLLGEGTKHALASQLFDSVHQKIGRLPDGLELLPAHGAGSMCGAGMGERPQSTLGYERACNRWFGEQNREAFTRYILNNVPPFPPYYRRMKRVNSDGLIAFVSAPDVRGLSVAEFRNACEREEAVIIDLRRPEAFGGSHIPGSLSIAIGPLLSVWAAWVVPYDTPLLLVGDDSVDYSEAFRALARVGLDNVRGFLEGGMKSWSGEGNDLAGVRQVSVVDAESFVKRGGFLLDVRGDGEWDEGHAPGAHHIMAGFLADRLDEVPTDQPIYTICGGGYRSSVAASLLKRAGFRDVSNVSGGMNAWKQRDLPLSFDGRQQSRNDAA